jgi:hypothetical protein
MSWKSTYEYQIENNLVLVLCQVTKPTPANPEFARACELDISSGDHADGEKFVSIGSRDEDGEWFVAGWDMTQDCWTDARCFTVLGWQSMPKAYRRIQDLTHESSYDVEAGEDLRKHWKELTELSPEDYANHVQGSEHNPYYEKPSEGGEWISVLSGLFIIATIIAVVIELVF